MKTRRSPKDQRPTHAELQVYLVVPDDDDGPRSLPLHDHDSPPVVVRVTLEEFQRVAEEELGLGPLLSGTACTLSDN